MKDHSTSRRSLIKGLSLFPVAAATAVSAQGTNAQADNSAASEYRPSFFNGDEWAFVIALCDRLIPHDAEGPGAVELGVPEFLDRHMQTPYAAGDIWYMQGPFIEVGPEFGYQGRLPLRDILRVGIKAIDGYCRQKYGGKNFVQLDHGQQETVMKGLEKGEIKLEEISGKLVFQQFLAEVRYGYFADPKYGGNKDMGSWKMIGYPGVRADYLDWVGVRDKAYPLPPVDLSGRRG